MKIHADIRAHIDADALLQREINHALSAAAEYLAMTGDLRLVRILTRTLGPSWSEHISFQEEVIFPIAAARHGGRTKRSIALLRADHDNLSQQHGEIGSALQGLLDGRPADLAQLGATLHTTIALRRSHFLLDAELHTSLPAPYTWKERSFCIHWMRTRPRPRFPLNLLRDGGRSIPQVTGRIH
ncbi:MAG TPA: hypothetical protein VNR88_00520 [Hyphomicrobium sp.]|nr:hypothetical protein [Hyphomicrobium sp.]